MAQIKLAEYTFDNSVGDVMPSLTPNTITMTTEDSVSGTTTRRIVYIDNATMPTQIGGFRQTTALLTLDYLNVTNSVTTIEGMFYQATNMTYINVSNWDVSNITNMKSAFYQCTKLQTIEGLENWNVSKNTTFHMTFYRCEKLKEANITNWKAPLCTDMHQMFRQCYALKNLDLSSFEVSTTSGVDMSRCFQDCTNLKIAGLNTMKVKPSNLAWTFANLTNTEVYNNFDLSTWDTSKCTNMSDMFNGCSSLTLLDLSSWDTSKCTNMSGMFRNCSLLTEIIGLENWDTSKVTNMNYMLAGLPLDGWDISNLNTSSVNNMSNMFESCIVTGNLDLSFFDVRKVTNMTNMFAKANISDTIILDNWDLNHNATNITYMFQGCKAQYISFKWKNTDKITSLKDTFNGCPNLISLDFSSWDTTSLTNIQNTFMSCGKLAEVDLSSFDFRNKNVATGQLFTYSKSDSTVYYDPALFKLDPYSIGGVHATQSWVVRPSKNNGYWLDMTGITGATEITLYNENNLPTEEILTDWGDGTQNSELTHTYSTAGVYVVVSNLQMGGSIQKIGNYTTKAVIHYYTKPQDLFFGFLKLTEIDFTDNYVTLINEKKPTNFGRMFYNNVKLQKLPDNLSRINTSSATSTSQMFYGLRDITSENSHLDLSWMDVSNVTDMTSMFEWNVGIKSINTTGWNTSKVQNMTNMFHGAKGFTNLDLSHWNVSSCTNMISMFNEASGLVTLNATGWNTSKVTTISKMFWKCTNLTDASFIESWDFSSMDNMVDAFAYSGIKTFNFRNKTLNKLQYCATMLAYNTSLESVDFSGTTMTYNGGGIGNPIGMFDGCTNLKTAKFDNMTFIPKNCSNMFRNCSSLTSVDLSSWDVSQCTNMSSMFNGCGATSINTKGWDTSKVTNMAQMFQNMKNIVTLDLSHFDTGKVSGWDYFASGCSNLKNIDVSSFVRNLGTGGTLFIDNPLLESVDMSNWETPESFGYYFRYNPKLKTIGMLYCSAKSINNLLSLGFQNNELRNGITIYYYDADPSQLTPIEGVTFKKYQNPTTIQLPPHIQLHSLPDGTRDEVDIKTGILTRNVGCIVLDGSETWYSQATINNNVSFYTNITVENVLYPTWDEGETIAISNHFAPVTSADSWREKIGFALHASKRVQVYDGVHNDADSFKQWVSSNNIKIIYQLETPTTEKLILNYNHSCEYGRILPTGMCDKYSVVNSMYTQTMASILLDGANTWDAMEEFENTVKFTATGTTVGVENLNMLGAGGLYCDNDLFPNINDDSDVPHCRVDEAGNKFYIYVDKEMLMSPDLIGWQIWLQANKFNLIYELAEHLTYVKPYEELDPTQARWEGMDCMRDGAIKYHTNSSDNITMYPTLEYIAPSINNFEVTMLEPNTDYTIYAEGINANDVINLGGTDINFNNGTVVTSGDNQWLRVDNNDSFYNMVITKGDTTGEVVPYFEGMTSVENPKLLSNGKGGNLFNGELYVGMLDYLHGNTNTASTWYHTDYLELEQNTDYCFKMGTNSPRCVFYDENKQYISGVGTGTTKFNTGSAKYTRISAQHTDSETPVQLTLIKGTTPPTEHMAYSESIVSYTDLKLRSLPNGVKDTINVVTGEYVQRVGEREYQDGDLTNENVLTDGINTMYELENYMITKLDPQTLLAYTDGTINLSSDTGLLPTTHYTVPSTNTFHLPSMKTGTRYTLKYPSASGSITIGDINYSISSDSMLFTTPLKINGDTSAIIFSDANPENVVLLEGAYNKREVPFFTGVKSVKNPNITITDQLSTESTTYNCETEIELRGLPNGVADKLDIIKGKLTTNVGIRPYQEGDENLPNVWTDGYETVYALSSPVVKNVIIDNPTVTTNSLIELSSDYLIPQLNYRAPSSNNFPLDLLQPNTTYTLYADTLASGSYTLGGTRTGVYSQPHTITLGDMTDNLLTFNGDLGLSNVMLVKGNSLKTTLPPYFLGIRSVTDGHLLVEGMAGEINEITFDEGIVLRDCNGVKDIIDLITCTLTKRTGEITLTGAEGWYRADSESTTDYNVFKLTLGGLKEALVMCDTLQSVFDTKIMDCIHAHTNELCIVIANATIGGNTVNALKSWLNQHPTTVVYQLRVPIEVQLENVWTTTPPTSYSNQTEISSTVSTNSLKPMISVTIATTTLEEIVSNLETQNAQLEEENLATMLALTSVYETMVAPSVATTSVEPKPQATTYSMRRSVRSAEPIGMSVSPMGMVYARLVSKGFKSIDEVPYNLQAEVMYALRGME